LITKIYTLYDFKQAYYRKPRNENYKKILKISD